MPPPPNHPGRRRLGRTVTAASLLALAGAGALVHGGIGDLALPWRLQGAAIEHAWANVPIAAERHDCSVALYGDSILYGAHNGMNRLPDPPAALLRELRPMYRVDDHSFPGDSAHAHVAQFIHTPLTSRIVVLQYGINDAGQGHDYRPALETMVAYVRSQGRTPVITGLSRVIEGIPRRDAYDAVAREIAAASGSAFADWGAVRFEPRDMADPVHPGQPYAERLTRQLMHAIDAVAPECARLGAPSRVAARS